ncbi:MAG: DUF3465 domain-containing protein [Proteobacteria bacterium]|nr:DUF3465 domain-containing protein [Pseudomonadota bacterium]
MEKSVVLLASVLIAASVGHQPEPPATPDFVTILEDAFENNKSNFQIQGEGIVTRILTDDLDGSRHQRFILQISPKLTVLVAHNIDIAPRVQGLIVNSTVEFYGEYEWNDLGGVIHWTHHDPDGYHIDGWLKYNGETYQ